MKKSVNMHVSKNIIEYLWLLGRQISKIEEMNNECVGEYHAGRHDGKDLQQCDLYLQC